MVSHSVCRERGRLRVQSRIFVMVFKKDYWDWVVCLFCEGEMERNSYPDQSDISAAFSCSPCTTLHMDVTRTGSLLRDEPSSATAGSPWQGEP